MHMTKRDRIVGRTPRENAKDVIEANSRTVLSVRDARRFLEIIDDGIPNDALIAAARRHRERKNAHSDGCCEPGHRAFARN
jgi:uncharacterized protein (DUF1778 family)